MLKVTVLICFVLCSSEVAASPSVNNRAKTLTMEELNHMIQVTISQSLQDILQSTTTTTPAPIPMPKTELATMAPPWQNLTNTLEELVTSVKDLNPSVTLTPALASDKLLETIEEILKNQTESIKKLAASVEQLAISASPKPVCGSVSGYVYWPVTKSCYKVVTQSQTWPVANTACLNDGAHLAVINHYSEAQYLNIISNNTSNVYVGVYKDSANQWTTVTGDTVERTARYHIWGSSEPFVGSQWLYASLNSAGSLISRGASAFPFICEMTP